MAKKKRKPHRKHRAAFQIKGNAGRFASRERDAKLTYLGDPLERINAEVPWEMFRADLQTLYVQQIAANRTKAAVRARVEHVFGYMHTSVNRIFVRTIGLARARMHLELTSLTYNMARLCQLQRARCWRTTA